MACWRVPWRIGAEVPGLHTRATGVNRPCEPWPAIRPTVRAEGGCGRTSIAGAGKAWIRIALIGVSAIRIQATVTGEA